MAGPQLTQFLAAGDYETYKSLVREYNHDAVNAATPITTECSILSRIIDKLAPEDIFTDPEFYDEGGPLAAEAKELLTAVTALAHYFWPPDGTADTVNRDRWKPYDATAWDNMIEEYRAHLDQQLQPVLPLFERLRHLEETGAVRTDGKAAPIARSRNSISFCIGKLEELLEPEAWEERLDEWLERITQKA